MLLRKRIAMLLPTTLRNTHTYRTCRKLLLSTLDGIPPTPNVEYNRFIWDAYAKSFDARTVVIDDPASAFKTIGCDEAVQERRKRIKHLGDEWGTEESVKQVMETFLLPFIDGNSVVAEIGSGGGRIASKVAGRVKSLYCFDVSVEMLKHCHSALAEYAHVQYMLLKKPGFDTNLNGTFDFIYSFDVFVHLDLHTIWKYFLAIERALKPGGKAFLHTANLAAPGGWERFAVQETYEAKGFYFLSPEIIGILAGRSGMKIIQSSSTDPYDFYLNRDYLFVLEKRIAPTSYTVS